MKSPITQNTLFYGDNLEIMRNKIEDETVDLCYIDPPFNSKRNYNQIYNRIDEEDKAQSQAFIDTWRWDEQALEGFEAIVNNTHGIFTKRSIELIIGLSKVLGEGGLLAYLVSMTLRIAEIYRVLKPTGSFYLHCDPTASHYLKLVTDAIFCDQGGDFINEIIWHYRKWPTGKHTFQRNHDVILFYARSSSKKRVFNQLYMERAPSTLKRFGTSKIVSGYGESGSRLPSKIENVDSEGVRQDDVWDIGRVPPVKMWYPTQKPEALLERIIKASSNEGDVVFDAYCGCGTTVVMAQQLNRQWIGIDITYQSISVVLERLESTFKDNPEGIKNITLDGIPRDMASAKALAHKKDDRLRKEFEKWAILTFSNNRAIINTQKGADKGIDGIAYFQPTIDSLERIVFQVKSGNVKRSDIATLNNDRQREQAQIGILLTLEEPTKPMRDEARSVGVYFHPQLQKNYPRIQIVTIQEIIEQGKRIDMPLNIRVTKTAKAKEVDSHQIGMDFV